jgi:hypothetical protein
LLVASTLLTVAAVEAQTTGSEQYYLDEKIDEPSYRYALGLGFGLVDLGDDLVVGNQLINDDDIEQYYSVGLRIGFGERRSTRGARVRGYRGYFEPEVAYWENDIQTDMLVGVNILGATPVGGVEFFAGGGIGWHFLDTTIDLPTIQIDESEGALGVNAQFGVDVSISESASLFGMGRFDLVDGDRGDDLQTKAYVGLRFRFGDGD